MVLPLNRRRASYPRFPVRVPAVTEPVGIAGPPELGEVENLSRGGLLLKLAQARIPGTLMGVTLRLRHRPLLTLTGTVVWVQPHPDGPGWALGIQFDEELPGELVADIADEEHPPWISH